MAKAVKPQKRHAPRGTQKRNAPRGTLLGYYLSADGDLPSGYHRLLDAPEVASCINRMAAIISSATIYLMRNTKKGDVRQRDRLSRFVDIEPWPDIATRQVWMSWIVTTLLGPGDGNAFVLPVFQLDELMALRPMPGAQLVSDVENGRYTVNWRGRSFGPNEVLHFRIFADPDEPWKGRGFRVQAEAVAASLGRAERIKAAMSSPDYKPPIVISVDSDADLTGREKRDAFRREYIEDNEPGEPWILPEGFVKVQSIRPLTLTDLAIKDTVELDKKTVAAIFGVPLFLLGLGTFSETEYNNFIKTVIEPICVGIEQELTLKLLRSEQLYFLFNRRRLYAYDLASLISMDLKMADRGYLNGDEVREDAYRDPAGLTEYVRLENYIPTDKAGDQKKLIQKEDSDDAAEDENA